MLLNIPHFVFKQSILHFVQSRIQPAKLLYIVSNDLILAQLVSPSSSIIVFLWVHPFRHFRVLYRIVLSTSVSCSNKSALFVKFRITRRLRHFLILKSLLFRHHVDRCDFIVVLSIHVVVKLLDRVLDWSVKLVRLENLILIILPW
jgi:hypothetical protein